MTIYFGGMFAVIQTSTSWWHHLAFNWFDLALVAVLAVGFWRGRKRGMTKELLPTLQWVSILLAAGLAHVYLADFLQQQGLIRRVFGNSFNERTAALMTGYITIAVVVFIIFTAIKRKFNPKLEGSSFFGSNEYYWGVPAGIIRYFSMVLIALALLNAPFYSEADIAKIEAYNNRWYGGGMKEYSGNFIPRVDEIQVSIFRQSLLGPLIKNYLSILLINPSDSAKKSH